MITAEQMYKYARENKLGFNITLFLGKWLQTKSFRLIEKNLIEDEEVVCSFIGRHKDLDTAESTGDTMRSKPKYRDTDGFYAYAITTESRILYAKWKPFRHDCMTIPLNNVNNVNVYTDLFFGSVKVETFGEDFFIFWTSGTVRRICKKIQFFLSDSETGAIDGITKSKQRKLDAEASRPKVYDRPRVTDRF